MFSSAGHLKSITCPFFAEGNCKRCHCAFRHEIISVVDEVQTPTNANNYVKPPSPTYGETSFYNVAKPISPVYENRSSVEKTSRPQSPAYGNYADTKHSIDEYDPAANYGMGLPPLSPLPLYDNQYSEPQLNEDNENNMVQKRATNDSMNRDEELPVKKLRLLPSSSAGLERVQKKTSELLPSFCSIPTSDLFKELDSSIPTRLSPLNESSSETTKSKNDDASPVEVVKIDKESAKPSNPTSTLVEAAKLRTQRRLLTPREQLMARQMELEASSSAKMKRENSSKVQVRESSAVRSSIKPQQVSSKQRPRIPFSNKVKVSMGLRQKSLDKVFDELLKSGKEIDLCNQEALKLEQDAYERSNNDKIYSQIMPNVIAKIRRELGSTTSQAKKPGISHNAMLMPAGAHNVGVKVTSPTKEAVEQSIFSKNSLYNILSKYVLR